MAIRKRFDKRYYDRFYGGKRAMASYRRDERRLADFVFAYLKYLGQPVRSVVDIGCGFGQWREIVREHHPKARYTGVETSEYLCEEYGWTQGSAVDFRARGSFDLAICKDTLQYLSATDFRASVANLSELCRGALYLSVLTTRDWEENCDRRQTDDRVYLRSARWYRNCLAGHFTNVGGGLFLSGRSPAMPWELEQLSSLPGRHA